jgi:hypothetical protein
MSSFRLRAVSLAFGLYACQPLEGGAALGDPFTGDTTSTTGALETPAIELADGTHASDACDATSRQALEILDRTCAHCHGGDTAGARQGSPPFDCVLDETRLTTMISATAKDSETHQQARFLVPGDPDHSRIYVRVQNAEMPPPDVIGLPANPRPSVSDLSVLRHWIERCVESSDSPTDNAPKGSEPDTQGGGSSGSHTVGG